MKRPFSEIVWEWTKALVVAIGMALFIRYFVLIPVQVEGDSMEPALQPASYILYHQLTPIDRFDIILFHDDYGEVYIKRVVGLPGETVAYENDRLYINGELITEPFLKQAREENQIYTTDFSITEAADQQEVPAGHYFVLGDNRPRSKDSRMFGFVPEASVEGKAQVVIYPLNQITWIK